MQRRHLPWPQRKLVASSALSQPPTITSLRQCRAISLASFQVRSCWHLVGSVRVGELVRSLLVTNDLADAIEVALERVDGDDKRSLETFKFPRSTSDLAIVGRSRHPVTLFEHLIAVLVDVSTEPVNLRGLCGRIRKAAQLTASTHVVEYRVSGLVRGCHGLVHKNKLSAAADRHWLWRWNRRGGEYDRDRAFRRHALCNSAKTGQNGNDRKQCDEYTIKGHRSLPL